MSPLRLRGRRLTGTSGAGLPSPRRAAVSQPPFPAAPAPLPTLSSQARRGRPPVRWGECGARPRACGAALPPSPPPAVVCQLCAPRRRRPRPAPAHTENRRRHVAPGDPGRRRRPAWPPGPEWGRLGLGVSLRQRYVPFGGAGPGAQLGPGLQLNSGRRRLRRLRSRGRRAAGPGTPWRRRPRRSRRLLLCRVDVHLLSANHS